jgi:hypothetical protein
MIDFSDALRALKDGKRIRPKGNAGGYIHIKEDGKMYFYDPRDGCDERLYYIPTENILRTNWEVVE